MNIEKLNAIRKQHGLSIVELAELSKLPKSTVEKVLFGIVKHPRIDTMQAIENALGITSQWTEEEITQGAGIEPVALEQEELYWVDLLNRVKDKLGEKYLSAVLQMLETTLQNK